MTTPVTQGSDTAPDRSQSIIDWVQINSRLLTIGAAVIVVAGAGYWVYLKTAQTKAVNAERALLEAKSSMQSGNAALATSDLQKLMTRYEGTRAAGEGALLLADLDYQSGKYQDGIKVLQSTAKSSSSKGIEGEVYSLLGDGESQIKQMDAAAKSYQDAADAVSMAGEKATYQAKAARAYTAAGKRDEAVKIWTVLKDSQVEGISAEANVRLGELTASAK